MSKFQKDAVERIVATAVISAITYLLAAPSLDLSVLQGALLVAVSASISAVKALLARQVGDPDSAAYIRGRG